MAGPGVFGVPHLSEDAVAAFADGVLSAAAAARARRHCAECEECAAAVRGQREAALLLRSAQRPSLPSGLLARLSGVPMSAGLPPSNRGLPTVIGPDGAPVLLAGSGPAAVEGERAADESDQVDASRPSRRKSGRPGLAPPESGAQHFFAVSGGTLLSAGFNAGPFPAGTADNPAAARDRRAYLPLTLLATAAVVLASGSVSSAGTPAGIALRSGSVAVAPEAHDLAVRIDRAVTMHQH